MLPSLPKYMKRKVGNSWQVVEDGYTLIADFLTEKQATFMVRTRLAKYNAQRAKEPRMTLKDLVSTRKPLPKDFFKM